jgi:hypothetical protein
MSWIRRRRPSPAAAIALAALIVALGGAAFAAIPDSNGTIHGCYQKTNGTLRVVDASSDCRSSELGLDWNQKGPPGPPGSGLTRLGQHFVASGDQQVLAQAGPLTFTGTCRPPIPGDQQIRAQIDMTTSADHSAISEDSTFAFGDLMSGQTALVVATANQTHAHLIAQRFSAEAQDGTEVTGIFSVGVNVLGQPGKCMFGGHVVVGAS